MAFDDSDLLVVQQHASGSLRKATVGSLLATIPQSTTWERDGTTLKTVFEDDDVIIGDTSISLRSDGHASFGGGSTPTNSGVSILAGGTIKASKDNGLDSALDIYTVGTNDPTIQLNANGSADFAGVVNSGPISVGTASSTALGVQLSNGGLIRVQRPSTAGASTPVFSGFNGNTENITLTSGGAATLAGLLTVDRDSQTLAVFKRAGETRFAVGTDGVYVGTDVSPGGSPITGNNISLRTDGSASFAGSLEAASIDCGTY